MLSPNMCLAPNNHLRIILLTVLMSFFLVACGPGEEPDPTDVSDAGVDDVGVDDGGVEDDTGPEDTGPEDTEPEDTGPEGCPEGQTECGGTCVATEVDPGNCGGCGVTCEAGEVCAGGQCALTCQQGLIECEGTCVDPQTSNAFCGASGSCDGADAGAICEAGTICSGGECAPTCQQGLLECGGTCVDPQTSNSFCGAGPDCSQDPGEQCGTMKACYEGVCSTVVLFEQVSYDPAVTFQDAPDLMQTRVGVAWDGTNLWTSSGGSATGNRLSRHDAFGNQQQYYSPGVDIRSIFPKGDGTSPLYMRPFTSNEIYVQTAPGVFELDVTLEGAIASQASVVWDADNDEFIAMEDGVVTRWDESGALLGTVTLSGFGELYPEENVEARAFRLAWAGGFYLTYVNGRLWAWSEEGERIGSTLLNDAGIANSSHFSFSYAQGRVFVLDEPEGTWRGYDVGL